MTFLNQEQSPHFTKADIERLLGSAYAGRGQRYQDAGKVRLLNSQSQAQQLDLVAMVEGTRPQPYRVEVMLHSAFQQPMGLEGRCTCPVAINCKHVAATLFHYLHQPELAPVEFTTGSTQQWLSQLKKVGELPPKEELSQAADRVHYVLILVDSSIQIRVFKVRHFKDGRTGGSQELVNRSLYGLMMPDYLTPADREIIRLLRTLNSDNHRSNQPVVLRGELGELALQKMLDTERAHWEQLTEVPLTAGEARVLNFLWHTHPDHYQLGWQVNPSISELFSIERYWYISENQVGILQCAAPPSTLAALLAAPMIPREELSPLIRELLRHLPQLHLPIPPYLRQEMTRVSTDTPEIHLELRAHHRLEGESEFRAFLSFDYKGVRIGGGFQRSTIFLEYQQQFYQIERQADIEEQALQQLIEEFGLSLRVRPLKLSQYQLEFCFKRTSAYGLAQAWATFLYQGLPRLEQQGWQIDRHHDFQFNVVQPEQWHAQIDQSDDQNWSLNIELEVDGERLQLLPLLVELLQQQRDPFLLRQQLQQQDKILLPLAEKRWLELPTERVIKMLDTLIELYDSSPLNATGHLTLNAYGLHHLTPLLNDSHWLNGVKWQQLQEQTQQQALVEAVKPPEGLRTTLRDYQKKGLDWLQFLRRYQLHGVLADDMGLGKTVQTLAHILCQKETNGLHHPVLIVVPTSVLGNWSNEIERFAPDLSYQLYHGEARQLDSEKDVIITTYALLRLDLEPLSKLTYELLVLDEAHKIKNPRAKITRAVCQIKARQRLCLTGTPLENNLQELWSLFHFLMPGFLGSITDFNKRFRFPIEKHQYMPRQQQLQHRIRPFMMRRNKQDVLADLPPKNEMVRYVTLEQEQRDFYESIRLAMDSKVRQVIAEQGLQRSRISILDALLKLRQICCDPRLVKLEQAQTVTASAKLDALKDLCQEIVAEGGRILLFSQFVTMLDIIAQEFRALQLPFITLTGQTRNRQEVIEAFQEGQVPVFLISLKAGGLGLNLTAADTVIHYDPWWNPAVENQATDRAWRIGQDKKVFVYRLICKDTLEEKMMVMKAKKQALLDSIYGAEQSLSPLSADELLSLFEPSLPVD